MIGERAMLKRRAEARGLVRAAFRALSTATWHQEAAEEARLNKYPPEWVARHTGHIEPCRSVAFDMFNMAEDLIGEDRSEKVYLEILIDDMREEEARYVDAVKARRKQEQAEREQKNEDRCRLAREEKAAKKAAKLSRMLP